MIKGLENIGINWEVKGESIVGEYGDQKGNVVSLVVIEPPSKVPGYLILVKSKAGWIECKFVRREKEAEFVKMCQDIFPDIEGYTYNSSEGWNYSSGEDK